MPDRQTAPRSFEAALVELEAVVEKMEGGDLSLEDSVTAYERGVALHGYCEQALSAAERKVRILTEGTGEGGAGERLRPFGADAGGDPPAPEWGDAAAAPRDTAPRPPPPLPSRPPADGASEVDDLPF